MDPYDAYQVDEAVGVFGNTIANEIDAIDGKNAKQVRAKKENHLRKRLGYTAQYRRPTPA